MAHGRGNSRSGWWSEDARDSGHNFCLASRFAAKSKSHQPLLVPQASTIPIPTPTPTTTLPEREHDHHDHHDHHQCRPPIPHLSAQVALELYEARSNLTMSSKPPHVQYRQGLGEDNSMTNRRRTQRPYQNIRHDGSRHQQH